MSSEGHWGEPVDTSIVETGAMSIISSHEHLPHENELRAARDLFGISATLAGFANFSDLSFLARLSTSVRVPGLVPSPFALSWAGGGDGKEFTYFGGNHSLSAELRVSYEFNGRATGGLSASGPRGSRRPASRPSANPRDPRAC